jgi:hypothetical protein
MKPLTPTKTIVIKTSLFLCPTTENGFAPKWDHQDNST